MNYPLQFVSYTEAAGGTQGTWTTRSGGHVTPVAIPPEFSGPGGALSPEDLFSHVLTNCFVATFKVFAQNSKLAFELMTVNSKLIVDLDDDRKPVMKTLEVTVRIEGASDREKALFLAQKAARSGFVLNSVKTACHFKFEV